MTVFCKSIGTVNPSIIYNVNVVTNTGLAFARHLTVPIRNVVCLFIYLFILLFTEM